MFVAPKIPESENDELWNAISSLTKAAETYRAALHSVAGIDPDILKMLSERKDLAACNEVIDAWKARFAN